MAETFHPAVNGLANSVVRVLEHLGRTGREVLVLAPSPGPSVFAGVPVTRVPSFRPPVYRAVHASGVPVLAAASGGPLDLVRHGEDGWLWAPDDPWLLGHQLATLLADPAPHQTMRLCARASVLGRSWERVGDELLGHCREVIGGAVPRTALVDRPPWERVA